MNMRSLGIDLIIPIYIIGRILPICHCLQYQSNKKIFISWSRNKGKRILSL